VEAGPKDRDFLATGLISGAGFTAVFGTRNGRTISDPNEPQLHAPLILPGLLTAGQAQSARPTDRLFLDYGYFNAFRVIGPSGSSAGFNLHQFDIGVEKTFLDSRVSVYASVPFLEATQNTSGQAIDGLGDINIGFKLALFADNETGNTLSAGFTASAPSGRDTVFPTVMISNDSLHVPTTTTTTQTLNPTYLQPWAGGLLVLDRLYVQEYLGVIIPTESEVATFINSDLSVGYQIFRGERDQLITSVTPTLDVQALIPVNHHGTPAIPTGVKGEPLPTGTTPVAFPDQLFLTAGAQVGLGEKTLLSTGVSIPVVGPRAYSFGVTVGLSFFF
jgi:hypothetical protein